ncbi:hypothetical protein AB0B30_25805 [Streptomyces narbonensis]|uniref:Uncharacterized protein n=1 Tax=Streptomyces narbonensis TaxID=67333 RepID=A0ABV3CB08_9ACTN
MISEPELVDGDGFVVSEVLAETPPSGPPRPPRARRPWLWALGGAVVASAVWGGGLYAYEKRQDAGPDMRGYKSVDSLCETAELKGLAAVLGERSSDGDGWESGSTGESGSGVDVGTSGGGNGPADPVLEFAQCSLMFGPLENGYSGSVSYTRHLVTDPGPEFDAVARRFGEAEPYAGLGERAYMTVQENMGAELRVLDGQVEIEINFTETSSWNGDEDTPVQETKPVDLSGIEVPLAQDMLALMEALKK